VKPSSSARCANFHESLDVAMPIPKSISFPYPSAAGNAPARNRNTLGPE
jgi:hypothetical protein